MGINVNEIKKLFTKKIIDDINKKYYLCRPVNMFSNIYLEK